MYLYLDFDPAPGTNTATQLDLKALAEQAAGSPIDWSPFIGLQGSENMDFGWVEAVTGQAFDPSAAGTYDLAIAVEQGGTELVRSEMQVQVVPEPITMAGLAMGLGGLVGYIRRRR